MGMMGTDHHRPLVVAGGLSAHSATACCLDRRRCHCAGQSRPAARRRHARQAGAQIRQVAGAVLGAPHHKPEHFVQRSWPALRVEKAMCDAHKFECRRSSAPTLWYRFFESVIFVGDPLVYDTRLAPGDTGRRPSSFWRRSRGLAPISAELRIAIGIAHGRPIPRRHRYARHCPFRGFGTVVLACLISPLHLLHASEAEVASPRSKRSTLSRRMRQNRPILKPSSSPRLRAFLATRVVTFSLFAASKRLSGGHPS